MTLPIEEFGRVCVLSGLIRVNDTTYATPDRLEAIEIKIESKGTRYITFWFKDGMRAYDQPIGSAKIEQAWKGLTSKKETIIPEVTPPKINNELVIGTVTALAGSYGISPEMANLFFVKFDGALYIKNPGLLFLAAKKGYGHITVTDKYNEKTAEWEAECKIYPCLTKEIIEAISKLAPTMQEAALISATMPTNGLGRAGNTNIRMKTMLVFARELAQTRAQNRALRPYTGYGGCSYEELEVST